MLSPVLELGLVPERTGWVHKQVQPGLAGMQVQWGLAGSCVHIG